MRNTRSNSFFNMEIKYENLKKVRYDLSPAKISYITYFFLYLKSWSFLNFRSVGDSFCKWLSWLFTPNLVWRPLFYRKPNGKLVQISNYHLLDWKWKIEVGYFVYKWYRYVLSFGKSVIGTKFKRFISRCFFNRINI